jgi:hypothetical protein
MHFPATSESCLAEEIMRRTLKAVTILAILTIAIWSLGTRAQGDPVFTFTDTPLLLPIGTSEPEIAFHDGFMAIVSLSWLTIDGTQLWTGEFGSTPDLQGPIDNALHKAGYQLVVGGGDASIDFGTTGTLHATTIVIPIQKVPLPPGFHPKVSVSAVRCINAMSSDFSPSDDCTARIIDFSGNDRPWITSDGAHVYICYHDAVDAALIRIQRSDDDGLTWNRVGNAFTGSGTTTAGSTFNNISGPIAVDPVNHNVYQIFAAGETGILKAKTAAWNKVFVSHSTDGGMHWTPVLVAAGPTLSTSENIFPSLAVDPSTGDVYAVWANNAGGTRVYFSCSADAGATWSAPTVVNAAPAGTALLPWVAANNGIVDVTYYGTSGSVDPNTTTTAVWNVYLAQTTDNGASFVQSLVSNSPNHVGPICTFGGACAPGTRNLLDLFQVGIDPLNGKAAVVYVDDTLTQDSSGNPLPQTVLAQQQ